MMELIFIIPGCIIVGFCIAVYLDNGLKPTEEEEEFWKSNNNPESINDNK